MIPWEEFEDRYKKNFTSTGVGAPVLCVSVALAALIIKEFITDPPFDASMSVHFRKRFPADVLSEVSNAIVARVREGQNPPQAYLNLPRVERKQTAPTRYIPTTGS